MASNETNLADRSGKLVESHKGYDPRIRFFHFVFAGLLLILTGGLAYQQVHRLDWHSERERQQNQRRILFPGPRGDIFDRNGTPLVVNTPRWTVVLHLDELKAELFREHVRIKKNFVAAGSDKKEVPSYSQLDQLARVSVAQRYLDQVNRILHKELTVDRRALKNHFDRELLLPFTLVDDIDDIGFARLIEKLPVNSALQVYATFTRSYPFGSAAAHTLGYVRADTEVDAAGFEGAKLTTLRMKNTRGRDGLERKFDSQLQGEAGGRIFRVDPAGYRINPPLAERKPKQGKSLTTSLDIDLQLAAEEAIGDQTGAAVALDVATGEVLVMASKPDYNLNNWYPRMAPETYRAMQEKHAEFNNALNAAWPPGSTFKILSTIAGLRSGAINPDDPIVDCRGRTLIGKTVFVCENGLGHHGEILLTQAIAHSCDIFFYQAGLLTKPDVLADEARRFHLDRRTGIELPGEFGVMVIPDDAWKRKHMGEPWYPGDTAQMAIGQSLVLVTPLGMACFVASVARGETVTVPTIIHEPNRPPQHTEPIGLTPAQRTALIEGMEGCTIYGTASKMLGAKGPFRIPGLRIAGKTGTAQKQVKGGKINIAWFICYAPLEKPEIAIAVAVEGDVVGESFEGGRIAAPIATNILKKYFEKKANSAEPIVSPFKSK